VPRAVFIHGFSGSPTAAWLPWAAEQLRSLGWEVEAPAMPDPNHPSLQPWLSAITESVGLPTPQTVLVGHSLGGTAILRYLEQLRLASSVGGAVLVGAPITGTSRPGLEPFFHPPLRWDRIRATGARFVGLYADGDPMVELAQGRLFVSQTGAKLYLVHARTHFYTAELPQLLDALRELQLG
jgi:predicted alpha/beta hydrolase family esterase